MCGIVGYMGRKDAVPLLLEGLRHLEYRGYDSAGIGVIRDGELGLCKTVGKISALESLLKDKPLSGTVGIAHTRWATHGAPSTVNAHPHIDCKGEIAVVHNGIVENFASLKEELETRGHQFRSDTDTEVLAHLIEHYFDGNLESAVRKALSKVEGAYGIAVISSANPDKIVVARKGSPLAIGLVDGGEFVIASDASAIVEHTRQVIYLKDGEVATLTHQGINTTTVDNRAVTPEVEEIPWDIEAIKKRGYPHYMLKEIYEQPETIRNAMRGRLVEEEGTVHLGGLWDFEEDMKRARRLIITACGTSWHAALIGEYMIEEFVRIPVEVEYASEFRYRNPIVDGETLAIVVSQSGETADTLAAMREAQKRGAKALGICNVVGSTIARESDGGIYIHAGPEIGVASTKAFTSQVTVFALLTLYLERLRNCQNKMGKKILAALKEIPNQVSQILENGDRIRSIAEEYCNRNNFLYLGRGYNFPVALEGALKLKEISYIHAEGYPAAEMKHGPIALIDEHMPVVVIATRDSTYEKILINIQEVKARGGSIIAIANEGDGNIEALVNHLISVPKTMEFLTPLLTVIPLQLLAYYTAVLRGCDVDQPRNLAKSVTVE